MDGERRISPYITAYEALSPDVLDFVHAVNVFHSAQPPKHGCPDEQYEIVRER